jgi:hypothetical protein
LSDLGVAKGRIILDVSDVKRAQQEVQAASRGITSALSAIGIGLGAREFVQFAVEADRVATAFNRQSIAALSLAGSQEKLNSLLSTYERVTGGAVSQAESLSAVTRLMAIGMADSTAELERFVTAARGISIAMGGTVGNITNELQLAISNQSIERLDQLGLSSGEVRARIAELQDTTAGLSREMAYQEAIIGLATEKFGELARAAGNGASGMEKLRTAWDNFQLTFGQEAGGGAGGGGGLNIIFEQWASDIDRASSELQTLSKWMHDVEQSGARWRASMGFTLPGGTFDSPSFSSSGSIGGRGPAGSTAATPEFNADQTKAIVEWARAVDDIERQANADRLDATRQYEESRTNTIREYEQTIAREAADFGRARARAEEDHAKSIADVRTNAARNEARQAEDFARSIADTRDDSAERVADAREDANKRLAEMEEDYQRNRERALAKHNDTLLDAAGNLDAKAVYEAQRNFAQQQKDAEESHEEQRSDLQEQLQERLDDEAEALEESIRERQEAYDRQLQDAREADAERIRDMEADFELRKEREDEDRAIRLERLAIDHNDQLNEQARAHELRLQQITAQEAAETAAETAAHDARMLELGAHNEKLAAEQRRYEAQALADYKAHTDALKRVWDSLNQMQGPAPLNPMITPGSFPRLTPAYNPVPNWMNNMGSSSSSRGPITINIQGDGLNEREVAELVIEMIENEGG